MAQLIKLQDYVSRYEWNPFHYPSQYIRLKKQNWDKLREQWENEVFMDDEEHGLFEGDSQDGTWNFFKRNKDIDNDQTNRVRLHLPGSEKELVQYFLDELFPFQMKWATSTVSQLSYTDQRFYRDPTLKYFLQRFPDIYLVMYYPIFNIKNAPVDGDIILLSPVGVELIHLIEAEPNVRIMAGDERTWTFETPRDIRKEISPLISLKRTEHIVKSILSKYQIDLPIHKTILSKENPIVYSTEPYNTNIVGKLEHEQWFTQKRQLSAPLKSDQLKAMDALLQHCQTTAIKRPEWEDEEESLIYMDDE